MNNADSTITELEKGQGFTTGTCAQSAAKAAAMMLITRKQISEVSIELPVGKKITLNIIDQKMDSGGAICAVVKDSGDDPDVTDGIKIYAEVRFSNKKGITITGAEGVGMVTKPGLAVKVGEYAINPIPRKMIQRELEKVLADTKLISQGKGLEVIISVPGGRETAKQTFNPRLGIEGGISILGTTGIVEPKSLAAYRASLSLQLDVIKASGSRRAALVPGYVGEKFCKEVLGIKDDIIVKTGDHIGFMFEECARKGIKEVVFAGHIGKLVKVANGQFNTHCQHGDGRVDTIARYARIAKAPEEIIQELSLQETAESAGEILKKNNLTAVFDMLAKAVVERLHELVNPVLKINCYILSLQGEVLGGSPPLVGGDRGGV